MRISDWSSDVCSSDLADSSHSRTGCVLSYHGRIWSQPPARNAVRGSHPMPDERSARAIAGHALIFVLPRLFTGQQDYAPLYHRMTLTTWSAANLVSAMALVLAGMSPVPPIQAAHTVATPPPPPPPCPHTG